MTTITRMFESTPIGKNIFMEMWERSVWQGDIIRMFMEEGLIVRVGAFHHNKGLYHLTHIEMVGMKKGKDRE